MVSPSIVRIANSEDRADIWRLFLMSHRENGIFPLAHDKVDFFLDRALNADKIPPADTGGRGKIGVIGPTGRLEAIAFLMLGSFWYSHEIYLEELIVYVDPECRASGHAKACIAWMKDTADALDIKLFTGILSTDRTEAKVRLYDRYLPRVGAMFLYPIRGSNVKRKNHNMERASWLAAK